LGGNACGRRVLSSLKRSKVTRASPHQSGLGFRYTQVPKLARAVQHATLRGVADKMTIYEIPYQ
jgi:hypothetical protein